MSPRTGRPKLADPKTKPIHVRLSNEDEAILAEYVKRFKVTKTEAIRRGISKLKEDLNNENNA